MELVYMDGKKEPYTTSEIIAECAEVQHHTITRLVRDNKADFEGLDLILNRSRNAEFKNYDEAKEMINVLGFVEGYLESLTGNKRFIKKVFESPDSLDVLPAVYNLLLQKKDSEALLLVGFLTLGEKEKTILLDLLESLCRKM